MAASLRQDPHSIEMTSVEYNAHKDFTETELTIYGPPRVGAFDRLKISTVNKAKYDQPNEQFVMNFEIRPCFKHARKNKRGTELPDDA